MAQCINEQRGFRGPLPLARETGFVVCALALLLSGAGQAQSGAVKSGIRGRVVIAKELQTASRRPAKSDKPWYVTHANVRRSSGHIGLREPLEPAPRLEVVLEGAPGQEKEVRLLTVSGLRFSPSSLLVPKPARFKVVNKQAFRITVLVGEDVTSIAPGKFAFIDLDDGLHDLRIKELPAARARVRMLDKAVVLPIENSGVIPFVSVEGGKYKLGFYDGAEPLTVQEISIPDSKIVAVDASISANRVVTADVKDGGLTVVQNGAGPR